MFGQNRPVPVVQVKLGYNGNQLHIGLPIGIQRAHIPPVCLFPRFRITKRVGKDLVLVDDRWNDVFTEVMVRVWRISIPDDLLIQELSVENVVAHGCKTITFLAGNRRRVLRLFIEFNHTTILIHGHHTKLACSLFQGHFYAADCHVRFFFSMESEESTVIHLVNMIA